MAWVEWIIELAQKIPSTFWGVVIGSFFSLLGVALTNRASARRLALQFSHERELRNTDRDLALRKDVYLSVVEAARAGSIVLGKLANLDIAQESLMDGYIDKSPAIAKVYIIAKEETVRVVADVEFALSDSILRLTVRRVPLVIQRQELTLLDTQIADFGKERDRWLEEMKLHTLSGSVDQQRWKTIEGNFQFESQRVSETLAKRGNVASDLYAKQLEFARECMHESLQLSGLILPAITAMRKELGIPTDDKAFTEIFRTSIEKQKENLADFLGAAKDFDKPSPMEGPISRTTASMTP